MSYPDISSVNATNDLTQLFVYANTITNGLFMPVTLLAFFIIVMIGTYFGQIRVSGRARLEVSFAAAAFVTFGMVVIASGVDGLVNMFYIIISLAVAILGALWLMFSSDN